MSYRLRAEKNVEILDRLIGARHKQARLWGSIEHVLFQTMIIDLTRVIL